jgi:Ni,Fe-hydrogenase I cytochrome b subunit
MTFFEQIYDAGPNGHWVFLLCTVILGASGAFVTGRAIADTWRPLWQAIAYALLLTFFVRFIHFALFEEVLVSLKNYVLDAAILTAAAVAGYVLARRRQMASQYGWLQR